MSHNHNHNHSHHHSEKNTGIRLIITMCLNFIITIAEIVGGILSGSLSLISDALHNFSDGISVIISYIAIKLKQKERSYKHTFGLKRAEILAAVINSVTLILIAGYLFYESIGRLINPQEIDSSIMIIVAVIGLFPNILGAFLLKKDAENSLNIRSSYMHLVSDSIASVAVILGGLAIYFWEIYWVDPVLTIMIGLYIIKESYEIMMDSVHVLMEGAPEGIDPNEINQVVAGFERIQNIHHMHLWSVGENDIHLEAHIDVDDMLVSETDLLRTNIETALREKFNIRHITLQFECNVCKNTDLIKQVRK